MPQAALKENPADAPLTGTVMVETAREGLTRLPATITPYDMVTQAVSNGASIEVVGRLLELHERWEASRARKAFDAAMSDAKAEIAPIHKNRSVGFESKNGGSKTSYKHEDLAEVARTIDPVLAKHGLSYRFQTVQEGNTVKVTCIVAHRDGHSETNSLSAGNDTSGNKNSIQAIGSTITYLQRYTLKASLGLAASNDDDGAKSSQTADEAKLISEEQFDALKELIMSTGSDPVRFCGVLKINQLADLPAARFDYAHGELMKKAAKLKAAAATEKDQANG